MKLGANGWGFWLVRKGQSDTPLGLLYICPDCTGIALNEEAHRAAFHPEEED